MISIVINDAKSASRVMREAAVPSLPAAEQPVKSVESESRPLICQSQARICLRTKTELAIETAATEAADTVRNKDGNKVLSGSGDLLIVNPEPLR